LYIRGGGIIVAYTKSYIRHGLGAQSVVYKAHFSRCILDRLSRDRERPSIIYIVPRLINIYMNTRLIIDWPSQKRYRHSARPYFTKENEIDR